MLLASLLVLNLVETKTHQTALSRYHECLACARIVGSAVDLLRRGAENEHYCWVGGACMTKLDGHTRMVMGNINKIRCVAIHIPWSITVTDPGHFPG